MNTDRGLLFLTLCLTSFWLVFDEFFGDKHLSNLASKMTPEFPTLGESIKEKLPPLENKEQAEKSREEAKEKIEKNPKIDKDTKKDLKDLVDHFYGPEPA